MDKKLMHRVFALMAGGILFAWLVLDTTRATEMFHQVWSMFSPFVAGAVVAFVFNVPMRAIERQLDGIRRDGLRRGLAIVLTLLAIVLVFMFVVELLVPQIQLTAASLMETIPAFVERTAKNLMQLMEENPEAREFILAAINQESLNGADMLKWTDALSKLLTFLGNQVSGLTSNAVSVIGSLTSGIVNLVIALAFSMYCLGRKEILARQGRRILYALVPEKRSDEIIRVMRLTNATFSNFISGQCLEACILGALFAVAMAIFKMPYIPLVSVVIGVTALVPVVGAFVGCIVGAFFILVNDPLQALSFVALFLVLQQLEGNLIYPRVVGTSVGLPGMWVLMAVTVGGEIMGVAGMLLMIPLASVLYALAREFTDKRLAQREIPAEKLLNHPPELKSRFREKREHKQHEKLMKKLKEIQLNRNK
ncbi:MAG: AI-2E family transporter [Eubacteriales bacterium]|nr:AI-2E family transporter [Eubacteriales bacterium]